MFPAVRNLRLLPRAMVTRFQTTTNPSTISFLPHLSLSRNIILKYWGKAKLLTFKKPSVFVPLCVRHFSTENSKSEVTETSMKDKLKVVWKKYGVVAIGTYFIIYASTLGSLFIALDFDILNAASWGFDPVETVKKFCDVVASVTGYYQLPAFIEKHPSAGKFAIAWIMTKFTEPFRAALTLAVLPRVATAFGKYKDRKASDSS